MEKGMEGNRKIKKSVVQSHLISNFVSMTHAIQEFYDQSLIG